MSHPCPARPKFPTYRIEGKHRGGRFKSLTFGVAFYIAFDNRNNRSMLFYTNVLLKSGPTMFKYARNT